uniref:Uncharacterized protein n=1 Tax=Eutreptiella gymnastica TaxID=73025 RepID=A0A7S1NJG3_9EUGL
MWVSEQDRGSLSLCSAHANVSLQCVYYCCLVGQCIHFVIKGTLAVAIFMRRFFPVLSHTPAGGSAVIRSQGCAFLFLVQNTKSSIVQTPGVCKKRECALRKQERPNIVMARASGQVGGL